MRERMAADEARAWSHSQAAGQLWESGLRLSRAIAAAEVFAPAQNNCCNPAENAAVSPRRQSGGPAPGGSRESESKTNIMKKDITTHPASEFEIVFDNGGGATLQNHSGKIALNYSSMTDLARDASAILAGNADAAEVASWDGVDATLYISDDEYEKHASNGGYLAIQLDPEYRPMWPDAEETGWNNLSAFVRALTA
jgi:hypothetical protein